MLYFFIVFCLILLSVKYDYSNKKNGFTFFYVLTWIVFILVAGLRFRVGGDTIGYMTTYERLPSLWDISYANFLDYKYDPLWIILCALAKTISPDFTVLQIFHAFILNTIIFFFVKINTKYVFTSILVYFLFYYFHFNMEVIRESLAVAIFLISLKHFIQRQWLKYYLLVFVAFLFHSSATILFFLPLLKSFSLNKKNSILLFLIFMIGIFVGQYFIPFFESLSFTTKMLEKLQDYSNYSFTLYGIISSFLKYVIMPVLITYVCKKLKIDLLSTIQKNMSLEKDELIKNRYERFRKIGVKK